jgi:cobalt-zinc-cadmium efflux system protein
MFIIAVIGLIANISSILILQGGQENDMNVKGVFYHMIADAAASIGIIIASIIISMTGWNIIDPIVSIGISIIILFWSVGIIKDSTRVLLEMTPKGLDIDILKADLMKRFPEIGGLYNIHLWTITPEMLVFSCYLKPLKDIYECQDMENLISKINEHLYGKYKIIESTIQVTLKEEIKACTD